MLSNVFVRKLPCFITSHRALKSAVACRSLGRSWEHPRRVMATLAKVRRSLKLMNIVGVQAAAGIAALGSAAYAIDVTNEQRFRKQMVSSHALPLLLYYIVPDFFLPFLLLELG